MEEQDVNIRKPTVKEMMAGHENEKRRCALCGEYKVITDFHARVKLNKNGTYSLAYTYCKKCQNFCTTMSHRIRRARIKDEKERMKREGTKQ